jgi:hypothetical protein
VRISAKIIAKTLERFVLDQSEPTIKIVDFFIKIFFSRDLAIAPFKWKWKGTELVPLIRF